MKKQAIIYAFLVGSAFIIPACAPAEDQEKEEKGTATAKVEVAEVESTSFEHRIRVQGNVETDEDVMLTAEMGGLITSVRVKEGQLVNKGTIIATVDGATLNSSMQELKTQLEFAEYMLEKQEELNKRGVGSEFELEQAKNQVNSLKASMNSIGTQQGKTIIRAPFKGTIDQVYAVKGQMAGPSAPVVRLVNSNEVDITAAISEKHFRSVKEGTKMMVAFPNYGDMTMDLKVETVGNYIEPTNRTFRIKTTVKNNKELLPNMLAEISITDLSVENGIVIPAQAILIDQESNDYVYIVDEKDGEKMAKKVNIKVIERYQGRALIKEGAISPGQTVVVKGARGIGNGTIVQTK
ncbi:efflux RND transporter periplasmic adaptor subunit [Crocinitomicaceae bacterium]|nr:efflux RND transporter periplasmic adaptor subunit [Crocinitomicaceae bacterium]